MASLSVESLLLAGFTLAHAAWSVSDTTPDDLLCPLAILEKDGERRLVRFDAESQEQAIGAMKESIARARREGEAFAAAREGAWRSNDSVGRSGDVLSVEFWSPGMDAPAITVQHFRRASATHAFALLGEPILVVDGVIVQREDAAPAVEVLLDGVKSHSAVQPLWSDWQSR